MKSGIEVTRASAVPYGTSFYWGSFPGTSCLANFRCRFATLPNEGRETAATGQWMAGKRMQVGKGGRGLGKWTGFSRFETTLTRLFPQNSTQVVDFPHKATVRLFWERGFYRRGAETQSQDEERDRMDNDYRHNGRNGRARPIRRICILVAIFETERSLMFAYVRVKSLMFAFFEKKYFFRRGGGARQAGGKA